MKKIVSYAFIICLMFIFNLVHVNAGYWNDYFNGSVVFSGAGCSDFGGYSGTTEWKDINQKTILAFGGCGSMPDPFDIYPTEFTRNLIFNDVTNLKIVSSNENIIKAKAFPYDYSREKKHFEDYVKWYDSLTVDDFNNIIKEWYGEDYEFEPYKEKPTWWEYNNYDREYTSWYDFYGFESEPKNSVEVVTYAYDLGKAYLNLSADNKNDIKINWTIGVNDFGYSSSNKYEDSWQAAPKKGLIALLNNLDKYKDIISEKTEYSDYNFYYEGIQYYDEKEYDDLTEVLTALRGKDITIKFSYYPDNITINGLDIKDNIPNGFTFQHYVSTNNSKYSNKINALAELKNPIYIDFSYKGMSPFKYTLNLNSYNDDLDKNSSFTLLEYDKTNNKIEVVKEDIHINNLLSLELTFDKFSNYILVKSSDYKIYDIINIENLDVDEIKDYVYTGKNITSNIVIKNGDIKLEKDIDYTITYKNNKNIGTGTMVINGIGRYTGEITKKFNIVIDTLKSFKVNTQSTSSITLSFKKPTGKTSGYQIYMATSKDGKYSKIATLKSNVTSYKKTKLSTNKIYYFKIRNYYKLGSKTYYSNWVELDASTSIKTPSIKLSGSTSAVKVSWGKVSGATNYEVYQSTDKKKYTKVGNTSDLSLMVNNLSSAKTYYYKVRAIKEYNSTNIKSSYSKVVSVTTKPLAPKVTVSTSTTAATIKWDKVSRATGYEVYQSTNNKKYTKITTTSKNTYKKTKLTKGKVYYYKVRAYKTVSGKKVYSAYTTVCAITTPDTPTSISAKLNVEPLGTKVSYKKVNNVTGYEVYTSVDNKDYILLQVNKGSNNLIVLDTANTGIKTYYKVRSYVEYNGIKKYSAFSKVVSITKPKLEMEEVD